MKYKKLIGYLCVFIFINSFFFSIGSFLAKLSIENSQLMLPPSEVSVVIEQSYKIDELREVSRVIFSHLTDSIRFFSEIIDKITNYVFIFSFLNTLLISVVIYLLFKSKKFF
jgi:hypothetical protein